MTTDALAPLNDVALQLGFSPQSVLAAGGQADLATVLSDYEKHGRDLADLAQGIVQLWSVNEDNYRAIANQGWFQRVCRTLGGNNKRLQQQNEANLREIQRRSLLMMRLMMERARCGDRVIATAVGYIGTRYLVLEQGNNEIRAAMVRITQSVSGVDEEVRGLRSEMAALKEGLGACMRRIEDLERRERARGGAGAGSSPLPLNGKRRSKR